MIDVTLDQMTTCVKQARYIEDNLIPYLDPSNNGIHTLFLAIYHNKLDQIDTNFSSLTKRVEDLLD